MKVLIFDIMGLIGYNFISILCVIIAIVNAKNKEAWIVYAVGAIIQLLTIIWNIRSGVDVSKQLCFCFFVLIIGAVPIWLIYKKHKEKDDSDE